MATGIQWTDETWNPTSGCSKVSQGCKNCYAERVFPRPYPGRKFTDVRTHPDRLQQPLRWKRPRRVFVNSMSDLFHEDVPDQFIDQVFAVMALSPQHTFQVLTKRPERMQAYFRNEWVGFRQREQMQLMRPTSVLDVSYPLPNVWLGVSVEDQETADERIPLLLQTPAAVRFISAEPLLGPVDLTRLHHDTWPSEPNRYGEQYALYMSAFSGIRPTTTQSYVESPKLDWVIVGGESGPKARPCDVDWIRGIVGQCKDAGVPVFVKQLGARRIENGCSDPGHTASLDHVRDRKGGDPAEWPADLRVREFPA